jgi:hypothetical protein
MRRVADRAAHHAEYASDAERYAVLALRAHCAGLVGEIDKALDLLEQRQNIPENELPIGVIGFATNCDMDSRFHAGQMNLCESVSRKGNRIFEQTGDVWSQAEIGFGVYTPPLYCGRPTEAEMLIREAIPRAERVGHDGTKCDALWTLAAVHVAKGDLESAERTAREGVAFGESCHFRWLFYMETNLAGILLYRDQTEEALSLLAKAADVPATFWRGSPEGLLALGMTAAQMEGATNACMPRCNSCHGREPAGASERGTLCSA